MADDNEQLQARLSYYTSLLNDQKAVLSELLSALEKMAAGLGAFSGEETASVVEVIEGLFQKNEAVERVIARFAGDGIGPKPGDTSDITGLNALNSELKLKINEALEESRRRLAARMGELKIELSAFRLATPFNRNRPLYSAPISPSLIDIEG
jgi:hypothetical protein